MTCPSPLLPEYNPEADNSNSPATPGSSESAEGEFDSIDSDTSSDASTIILDLENRTDGIPLGLLRAWERNEEITRSPVTRDQQVQTWPPPSTPDSFSGYFTPNYSPVALEDINLEPIDISTAEDFEINQLLDYLSSEEFLDMIVDI